MVVTEEKKKQIKQTLKETRERRSLQIPKVYEMKVDYSHLNKQEKEKIKMYFVEAKWLYNYILSQNDPFVYDYKTNPIEKYNKEGQKEEVKIQNLPAKLKQGIVYNLQQNISNLSKAKKKGRKVGRLKFKSEYNSIELSQYGVTHTIKSQKRVKLTGIKKPIKVFGLEQITDDMEIANAKLVQKPDGYYIKLTTYQFPKGEVDNEVTRKQGVGIDFGIQNNLITSEGELFNVSIGESEHLKRLQRKMTRQKKGSNNRYKTKQLLRKEYQKISNKKKDQANKIVSHLLNNHQHVIIQDESLNGWHSGWFGKQVQHSAMGMIKAKLQQSKHCHTINKWLPTTKMCPNCGKIKEKNDLSERWFSCECGYEEDRDIKSAKTILKIGLIELGVERIEFKPVEKQPSTFEKSLDNSKASHTSMKQEAERSSVVR